MKASQNSAIDCCVADGVATVTLNQPDRGNPIDGEFCQAFNALSVELSERTDVRAVLIVARGRSFSVGGDIGAFVTDRDGLSANIKAWTSNLHMGVARFQRMRAPVVAAVHATAAGGAVALVAASDFVYLAKSARLSSAFVRIGYSCDSGSTVALARRMGISRAKRFLLLGETLSADQALSTGLADWVVEDEVCLAEATKLAQALARGPTSAYGEIKQLMARVSAQTLETQIEDEAQALARTARTNDAWEGLMAFKEKREPRFSGS
jgi:2-(1,2-epoxy-1,2-dihydrophenyl)acetyl-CoA isomerase